jgi:hypothetical protein
MCDRSLVRQEDRLRRTRVAPGDEESREFGREIMPDIWLTLVALNGSLKALALAARGSQSQSRAIRALRKGLAHQPSIEDARDVYEHIDAYYEGRGRLQKKRERPDTYRNSP